MSSKYSSNDTNSDTGSYNKGKKDKKDKKNKTEESKKNKHFKNISIETLFPGSKIGKNFDVTSFNTNMLDIDNFDPSSLTKQREEKVKKLKVVYKQLLSTCLHKIQILNDRDETDMVYKIPIVYYGYSKYEPLECLKYIEKKLRKKYFDTYIISESKIFVSWESIDENKKIQKELNS